jgi:gas vesicle protein
VSAGSFLIGMAVGLILGGLATYGAIFAWAMGYKLRENQNAE